MDATLVSFFLFAWVWLFLCDAWHYSHTFKQKRL